jgi:sec-independent protein translocase protein TatA
MDYIALFMGTPGIGELLVVLVLVLLLFGAKRLPDLSNSLGRSLSEFKKGREEGQKKVDEVKDKVTASPEAPSDKTKDA